MKAREISASKSVKTKPSGILWIGEIPERWVVERLQWHLAEVVVKNDPVRTTNVLSLTNNRGVIPYEDKGNVGNKAKENYAEYKVAYKNTIVANSMNILIGSVGLSNYDGCVSPVYYVFKSTGENSIRFFNYVFQLSSFQKELRRYANGILEIRLRVSANDILKRKVAVPNVREQRVIAEYLDEKCAAIDAAIVEAKKGIEEYKAWKKSLIFEAVTGKRRVGVFNAETRCARDEDVGLPERSEPEGPQGAASRREAEKMKPSGIPWIGAIPEGWRVSRVKNIANIQHGQDPKTEGSIPVYGSGDGSFKTCGEYKDGPAVLLGRKGATLHIPHYIVGRYWNVDTAFDVKMLGDANLRWFYYLAICFDYKAYMSQTTLPSMTQSDYRNMTIPIPEVSEQQAIADYLDGKCAAIDAMVAEKEALIADLESYKKSLIYETVTGKREVA